MDQFLFDFFVSDENNSLFRFLKTSCFGSAMERVCV